MLRKILACILANILFLTNFSFAAVSNNPSSAKLAVLYAGLEPLSITQNIAFWQLYQKMPLGIAARDRAWQLLNKDSLTKTKFSIQQLSLLELIAEVKNPADKIKIDAASLATIDSLCSHFPNRSLRGWSITSEEMLLTLAPEEIDLSKALFLDPTIASEHYVALLDLMTLQIAAKLPEKASAKEKIRAINDFLFHEEGFRFPPQSSYLHDIDLYSLLPSVLDKKRGICLGITLLYLCLSQRLSLPLEVITPPGHIYVRYAETDGSYINIETTARGMDINSEQYLGLENKSLQQRNIKEVVGLVYINAAAHEWRQDNYEKAVGYYKKAKAYLPDDMLLKELMAYQYLFLNEEEKALPLLGEVAHYKSPHAMSISPLAEDFLTGRIGKEGIKEIFRKENDKKTELLKRKERLEAALQQHPMSRSLLFSLAACYAELHQFKDALVLLNRYHEIDPSEVAVEYMLVAIYFERNDYVDAWRHFHQLEALCRENGYMPKDVKTMRLSLMKRCADEVTGEPDATTPCIRNKAESSRSRK
jgi:tetratricopeptide (TPR) repeat protein